MLRQAAAAFERQKDLLGRGNSTRRDYDQAEASLRSAKAQLDQAHADLTVAQNQVSYTELRADAEGIITGRMAEVGQVVAQAQPIYSLARDVRATRCSTSMNADQILAKSKPSKETLRIALLAYPMHPTRA